MTPKICVILATDEDGNQKYVELTQQQALAYNAGALPIIQVRMVCCSKPTLWPNTAHNPPPIFLAKVKIRDYSGDLKSRLFSSYPKGS